MLLIFVFLLFEFFQKQKNSLKLIERLLCLWHIIVPYKVSLQENIFLSRKKPWYFPRSNCFSAIY